MCLVSGGREVGADVESLDRAGRWVDLADRYFAPREAAALKRVAPPDRPMRFLEYWTLKESYIKARGLGLAIPLADFSFDLPARSPGDITIRFTPAIDDDSARWQFSLERLGLRASCRDRYRTGAWQADSGLPARSGRAADLANLRLTPTSRWSTQQRYHSPAPHQICQTLKRAPRHR